MPFDALVALLDDFGPGSLTVRTPDGLMMRPVMPVANTTRGELACVVEEDWLRTFGGRELNAALSYMNETRWTYLSIKGTVRRSLNPDDIGAAWSALATRWFPDGPMQSGIVALRFVPEHAELWDFVANAPRVRWLAPAS